MEALGFAAIRESSDFALRFGLPAVSSPSGAPSTSGSAPSPGSGGSTGGFPGRSSPGGAQGGGLAGSPPSSSGGSGGSPSAATGSGGSPASGGGATLGKTQATATTDERSVRKSLRALKIYGPNRAKLVTLRNESLKLNLKDNPIAFCFLLRSLFEISAKAYCQDHAGQPGAPAIVKNDGSDRALADVLRDIVSHLTQNKTDKAMVKLLHGPLTEIQRQDGILSLTSMNQLVHSASFTILPSDIPSLFSNIFPLLDQMNK